MSDFVESPFDADASRRRQLEATPDGATMIARIARILEAFDRDTPTMTLSALAARAGLPVPTTYRLVTEMAKYGLLDRDEHRQIHVGTRLWELTSRSSAVLELRETALPHMERLLHATGEVVALSIFDSDTSLYVERLSSEEIYLDAGRMTDRHELNASSTGLIFVAHGSQQLQEHFIATSTIRTDRGVITGDKAVRSLLASIRQKGYAYLPGIGTSEWVGLAAPVFGRPHQVVAALSIVYRYGHSRAPAHVPSLFSTATEIGKSIRDRPSQQQSESGRAASSR